MTPHRSVVTSSSVIPPKSRRVKSLPSTTFIIKYGKNPAETPMHQEIQKRTAWHQAPARRQSNKWIGVATQHES